MICLLVGHRGVGKTSLLDRIEKYFERAKIQETQFFDLDLEIIRRRNKSIEEIFKTEGEIQFRKYEEEILRAILAEHTKDNVVVALGAGYCGWLPNEAEVIWIRRASDDLGRIFLDRPRLDPEKTAIAEFMERKKERDQRYQAQAGLSLILREGVESFDQGEFEFFTKTFSPASGVLTLMPGMTERVFVLPAEKFEVRDDLVTESDLPVMKEKLLLAKRDKDGWMKESSDWPLELGVPSKTHEIVSVHERLRNESFEELLRRLEAVGENQILKAAPLVENFEELLLGYLWQQKSPERRAFLPRSRDGRWKWFRLFMKGKMPLNFWRLDQGSALDQPTLLEWLNHQSLAQEFAAVLGDPVTHSRTPVEQESFFAQWRLPVYAIRVTEEEWQQALPVLRQLGLKAAAVTSPLKHEAYLSATVKTLEAEDLQAVNTLFFSAETAQGHNTDQIGFREMIKSENVKEPVAVWGGGGTLSVIFKNFENAVSFSARTGQPRVKRDVLNFKPKTLIWACGRSELYKWPLHDWDLETVIDLNYTEGSMGKELAQALSCHYVSGLKMFKYQAEAQRRYWQSLMEGEEK